MAAIDFSLTEGDVGKVIQATLEDANGDVVDLTDSTLVEFRMRPQDGGDLKIQAEGEIVTPPGTDGIVRYTFTSADTDTPGLYSGEWYVEWGSSLKEHFPTKPKYTIWVESELS